MCATGRGLEWRDAGETVPWFLLCTPGVFACTQHYLLTVDQLGYFCAAAFITLKILDIIIHKTKYLPGQYNLLQMKRKGSTREVSRCKAQRNKDVCFCMLILNNRCNDRCQLSHILGHRVDTRRTFNILTENYRRLLRGLRM